MDDPVVLLAILALLVEIVYALWCAWDMRRQYGRRLIESLLWDRLIAAELRTVIGGLLIGSILVYTLGRRYLDLPPIPSPWGALGFLAGLMLLFYGPIADRWMLKRIGQGE